MKKKILFLTLALVMALSCLPASAYHQQSNSGAGVTFTGNEIRGDDLWDGGHGFAKGSENPRANYYPYGTEKAALEHHTLHAFEDEGITPNSPYIRSLNSYSDTAEGDEWKFHWSVNPTVRPWPGNSIESGFEQKNFNSDGWDDIKVPSLWQLSWNEDGSFKYDRIIYTNTTIPWSNAYGNPAKVSGGTNNNTKPEIPLVYNGVGTYRRTFDVPAEWLSSGRSVFLNLDGVDACYIWVNGYAVGYTEDHMTRHEFDVTPYITSGENSIVVQVVRWSIGSWLETQDMIRISGIARNIYLMARQTVDMFDFEVKTTPAAAGVYDSNWNMGVDVLVRDFALTGSTPGRSETPVTVVIYDIDGNELQSQTKPAGSFSSITTNTGTSYTGANAPTLGKGFRNTNFTGAIVNFQFSLDDAKMWSAEHPNLYKLVIYVGDESNPDTQYTCIRTGFREITFTRGTNARILINGSRLVFHGVNAHEANPETGRTMTMDLIEQDIRLMKQYNVNALRMGHYPHDRRYYDLCDEYGIYVMDEANVEAHEDRGISQRTDMGPRVRDRIANMFEMSKNSPSVVSWSVGNEAGGGATFRNYSANWLKARDPARPLHTEFDSRGEGDPYDMVSQMYPSPAGWASYMAGQNKPAVLCEFNHAMGNSMGNLEFYVQTFEEQPRSAGGFIWDWVDQSVLTPTRGMRLFAEDRITGNIVTAGESNVFRNNFLGYDSRATGADAAEYDAVLDGWAAIARDPSHVLLNNFTIDVDVYPTATNTGHQTIIGTGGDFQWMLKEQAARIQFFVYTGTGGSGWHELNYNKPSDYLNNWHRLTVTYAHPTMTMYYDGVQVASSNVSAGAPTDRGTDIAVGAEPNGNRPYAGYIGNARVLDRVLNATEIAGSKPADSGASGVVFSLKLNGEQRRGTPAVARDAKNPANAPTLSEGDVVLASGGIVALRGARVFPDLPAYNGVLTQIPPQFTVDLQLLPAAPGSEPQTIFTKGDENQFMIREWDNQIQIQIQTATGGWGTVGFARPSDYTGNWHRVTVTYNNGLVEFYYDGVKQNVVQGSNNVGIIRPESRGGIGIGLQPAYRQRDYGGHIAGARLLNKVLSESEILASTPKTDSSDVVFLLELEQSSSSLINVVSPPVVNEYEGVNYLAYGGHWGDSPNDNEFCANGMILADRTAKPQVDEMKFWYQNLVARPLTNIDGTYGDLDRANPGNTPSNRDGSIVARPDIGGHALQGKRMYPSIPAYSLADNFTIDLYVFPTSSGGPQNIFESGNDRIIIREHENRIDFQVYAGTTWRAIEVPQPAGYRNNWQRITATVSSGTAMLYLNGTLIGSMSNLGTLYPGAIALGNGTVNNRPFNGLINKARLLNRALTPAEINASPPSGWDASDANTNFLFIAEPDMIVEETSITQFYLHNKAVFTNANEFDQVWELVKDGEIIQSGTANFDLRPTAAGVTPETMATAVFNFPFTVPPAEELTPGAEFYFNLKFLLKENEAWADKGHVVSMSQLPIVFDGIPERKAVPPPTGQLNVSEDAQTLTVSGKDFDVVFDSRTGVIESYTYKGEKLIDSGPEPNFWRAPISNDQRVGGVGSLSTWRNTARNRTFTGFDFDEDQNGFVKVTSRGSFSDKNGVYTTTYNVYANGEVEVNYIYAFGSISSNNQVPEVGSTMVVAPGFDQITWYGRGGGEAESYADRKMGNPVGIWEKSVEDNLTDYIKPQASGNKVETRWLALTNASGFGLAVKAGDHSGNMPFLGRNEYTDGLVEFNAQHYTQDDLSSSPSGQESLYMVPKSDNIYLSVNLASRGVYCTTWVPRYAQINASGKTYNYSYSILPVDSLDNGEIMEWSKTVYDPEMMQLSFNANGGVGRMDSILHVAGQNLPLNEFTRANHSFAGWNTRANGTGVSYANGAEFDNLSVPILYAQWTRTAVGIGPGPIILPNW